MGARNQEPALELRQVWRHITTSTVLTHEEFRRKVYNKKFVGVKLRNVMLTKLCLYMKLWFLNKSIQAIHFVLSLDKLVWSSGVQTQATTYNR